MDEHKNEETENEYRSIEEATILERSEKSSNRKGSFLLTLLIGILIGVIIMFFIYQNQSNNAEPESNTNQTESINVDITTQITDVVDKVTPAVVGVTNLQNSSDFWRQDSNQGNEAGTGSGVIYKKEGDHAFIVTNHHVIDHADSLEVILSNETTLEAELLGSDLFMDLAVLKVDAEEIEQIVDIGSSENINVGEPVIAIGNPLGHMFSGSVTQGIISGKKRSIPQDFNQDGRADWQAEVLQTDAAINPGNSGGALINIKGELIGINSMKISQTVAEGIGFAIPIDDALPVIKELEEKGEVSRPYLGVELYSLDEIPRGEWKSSLNLPKEVTGGVYVWSVEPNSPADKAGLKRLDIITDIAGKKIENIVDLRKILYQEKSIDDKITITLYREGEKIETEATLISQN